MSTATVTAPTSSKAMNISLWVVQVLLAAMFGMAGVMKLTTPIVELAQQLPWVTSMPEMLVRFIGLAELAGALGLILPAATRIRPSLTPLAATGLIVVMILASAFHISRGEAAAVPMNFILAAFAAFVAWGRTKKAPIQARSAR